MCRAHFEKVGMGADYVDRFIRKSSNPLKNKIPKSLVQFCVFNGSPGGIFDKHQVGPV